MAKCWIIIVFKLTLITTLFTQNIYSALHHDRKFDLRDSVIVKEVITEKIFYNINGKEKKKEVTVLNGYHQVLSETRFDSEGTKTAKLSFEYDSLGVHSQRRKIERWQKHFGYSSEIASYKYDSANCLIKITDRNKNNEVIRETILENNQNCHPSKLTLKIPNNGSIGFEIASYDYTKNLIKSEVIDANGNVISTNTGQIDFSLNSYLDNKYNSYGDLIKSEKFEYQYKYDKFKNWTKQTIYKNVDGKRKKDRVFSRKIKYKK